MSTYLVAIVLIFLASGTVHPSSLPSTTNRVLDFETFVIPDAGLFKFASIVLKFFDTRRCTEANLATSEDCSKLSSIPWTNMNIYVGYDKRTELEEEGHGGNEDDLKGQRPPIFTYSLDGNVGLSPNLISKRIQPDGEKRKKVVAVLPDSSSNIKVDSEHDVVIVVDPYPEYNFGHFVGLFYVDLEVDPGQCEGRSQMYLTDRTCISAAKKPRCEEMSDETFKRYHNAAKCYIDFLPTVRRFEDFEKNCTRNLLECINFPEFRPCPQLMTSNDKDILGQAPLTHTDAKTRCRLFQRCDRGVLIGGGWNSMHSTVTSEENIFKMESMLISNGFLKENVKVFYGGGGLLFGNSTEKLKIQYSPNKKTEIRKTITKICGSKHCADTFFIYINTPTTSNGNFLLWDTNQNGLADDQEVYTVEEFLSDISKCEAQRVTIVSDQRRGDILLSSLQKSNSHSNVVLSIAGSSDQPTRNGELTSIWANHSHPAACLKHIQQAAGLWIKDSVPTVFDASRGSLLNLSLSGAPCGDLYSKELRLHYQGCQNLPTSIWFGSLAYGEIGSEASDEISVGDGKQVREAAYDSNVSYSRKFL